MLADYIRLYKHKPRVTPMTNDYTTGLKRAEDYATDWLSDTDWTARAALATKLRQEPAFVMAATVQGIVAQCERSVALAQVAALCAAVVSGA
jgi:hypothetical protein